MSGCIISSCPKPKKNTATDGEGSGCGTLASQLLNAVLYTLGAFWGIYSSATLFQIILSTFAIYVVTGLCDTPVVYIARRMKEKGVIPDESADV